MKRIARHTLRLVVPLFACAAVPGAQAQVLNRGDRVLVKVWVDSVFADTVRVGNDGVAVMPRLGPLQLGSLPLTSVADSVRRAYARVFSIPAVEVSPLIRVTALGEMRRPGVYFVEPGSELRDLVALAGGLTEIARESRVILVRGSMRTRVNSWQSLSGVEGALQSGDAIVAEREPWIQRNTFTLVSAASVLTSVVLALSR